MISQKAKLHNRFDFEIYDTETGETEYAQAENIVLNNMWTRLCAGLQYFYYIGIGTGSGTLAASRTGLFSRLAYKSAVAVETVYGTADTAHITKSVTFSETEAIGTWTEVGIAFGTATNNFVTHALITDSEGSPITVEKTNTKIITVYATVFVERLAPAAGVSGLIAKDQTVMQMLDMSTQSVNFWASALQTIDGSPSKLGFLGAVGATWTADAANKRKYTNLARFTTGSANADTGIRAVGLSNTTITEEVGGCGIPLTGVFDGHTFMGVAVGSGDGSKTEFDLPKDLVKPGTETIYINGVAKTSGTDYEIHYGIRSTTALLVSATSPGYNIMRGDSETVILPQPTGAYFDAGAATVTSVEIKATSSGGGTYKIELSLDGSTWVTAGEGSIVNNQTITMSAFAPAKYKFLRWSGTATGLSYTKVFATPPPQKQIKFTTPPASGAAITADFTVEYIPKSSNFVLDLQAEVVFGEGV